MFNLSEAVVVLSIIKLVICVIGMDWDEASRPEWTKEKIAKAMELTVEIAILLLEYLHSVT